MGMPIIVPKEYKVNTKFIFGAALHVGVLMQ